MTRNLKNVRPPRQECRFDLSVSMAALVSPPPMLPAIPFLLGKVTFPVHSDCLIYFISNPKCRSILLFPHASSPH